MDSPEYTVKISPNLLEFRDNLEKVGHLLPETIRRAALEGVSKMASGAAKIRMTNANPPFLNVRTGVGRASVMASPRAEVSGRTVSAAFGSQHAYIKAHEIGFHGMVGVRAHARKASIRTRRMKERLHRQAIRNLGYMSSLLPSSVSRKFSGSYGFSFVKGHSRRMNISAKHFLLRSFEYGLFHTRELLEDAIKWLVLDGNVPSRKKIASGT